MQIASEDGNLFYEVRGNGPPLVLLHPYPTNHSFWNAIAEPLSLKYKLILPDLRGHGSSDTGQGAALMAAHAKDLSNICDAEGVDRALFAGVSIGGYILFEFWRRMRERVRALMLCDTRAQADTAEGREARLKIAEEVEQKGPGEYLDSMIPKLLGESTRRNRPDLVKQARAMMGRMSVAGIAAVLRGMAVRPDSLPTLQTINVPTLIMAGEEDTLTPPAEAELMHQQIQGSRLVRTPAAGHYAPF